MNYIKIFLTSLIIITFFNGCTSKKDEKELTVTVTKWIGYAPIYFAEKKGWLKEAGIKYTEVNSLSENVFLFEYGHTNTYLGTQYEFSILKPRIKGLVMVKAIDKSNGGDMILSNKNIDILQNMKTIDTYLEVNSINKNILEAFIKYYNIDKKQLNIINSTQKQLSELNFTHEPCIIVTYTPYNIELEKRGYKTIMSTKNSDIINVIDGVFTTKNIYFEHKKQFEKFNSIIDKSIAFSIKNPKKYYNVVKEYLGNITFSEFQENSKHIQWINLEDSEIFYKNLEKENFNFLRK